MKKKLLIIAVLLLLSVFIIFVGKRYLLFSGINQSLNVGALHSVSDTHPAYVMISGYDLFPPIGTNDPASIALSNALNTIASKGIAGIVYGTVGGTNALAREPGNPKGAPADENSYNTALFNLAKSKGATIWLQLRYYDNSVQIAPGTYQTLAATDILGNSTYQSDFLTQAMATVSNYENAFPTSCTIILGEEETLYHSEYGGGLFWAGQTAWNNASNAKKIDVNGNISLVENSVLDQLFITNFSGINSLLIKSIQSTYPNCKIGIHIGDEPLYGTVDGKSIYGASLAKMTTEPDFTLYDLYEKTSPTYDSFAKKLKARIALLKSLGQPVYYLAQLQTTNDFGYGEGRTPSQSSIDATLKLAESVGVTGFGYYTKDAAPSLCGTQNQPAGCDTAEDSHPLDPNTSTNQEMVYQDAFQRWDYGISELTSFMHS